jgi:hypothetical protein
MPFSKELAMDSIRSALIAFSLAVLCAGPANADTLAIDKSPSASGLVTPQRGMSMNTVRERFGNPVTEHPPVPTNEGPLHPPITRWDYNGYSVYFENSTVLHAVLTPPEAK